MLEIKIFPNWFAPKVKNEQKMIHGIYTKKCNFSCIFCSQHYRDSYYGFKQYSMESFNQEVLELLEDSNLFKFTGGEPTVVPELYEMIKMVHDNHGKVFLDTNGSNTLLTEKLVDDNLINVLGVSIKGLTPDEAMKKANIKNSKLCWENVIDTCNYAYGKVDVILTYVVDSTTKFEDLMTFCRLIANGIIKVDYLKLNNLYGSNLPDETLAPITETEFVSACKMIIKSFPELENHIIGIPSLKAVREKSAILYY